MPNEYLRSNNTKLNIRKAENVLAIIEEKRKDAIDKKEIQSENSLFTELFKAFKDFFSKLGKPTLQKRFQKKESPARSKDYNDTMREIHDDINVAYSEEDALSSVMVKDFNYGEAERQMLLNKVRKLNSKSIDYSFYSTGAKTKSLYGVDTFVDNSKIDFSKISPGNQIAELVVNQGVVTLKRTGNINKSPSVSSITGIQESIPQWEPNSETGGYEGLYFGMKNEPRPEGGRWHIQYSQGGDTLYEMGASEEELMPRRLQMFDDNPDTFWEAEYITDPVVGYRNKFSGKQISVAEFNELMNNEIESPNVRVSGDTIVTNEHGNLIEDYIPVTGGGGTNYLTVNFTVFLDNPENVNWISLNPNNFGQELYLEVLSIQTSPDGKVFEELEGFDDHEYDIVLTREANQELIPSLVRDTLSPDKFKFAGQGIWVFSPRGAKAIRFTIRQTRSYNKPYEVLMVETTRQVTTTTTTKKWWGLSSKTTTTHQTITRQIEIPYLAGQITGFDVMDLEPGGVDLQANDGVMSTALTGAATGAIIGGFAGPVGFAIGGIIGFVIGGLFGSSKKTETSVGPESISRQWTVTKDDKARFAIGIRDINIYSYKFAETSEIVSQPYMSPKPIAKVALAVDEQIPTLFYTTPDLANTENEWIKYYISVNNGISWNRISPIHHKMTISEDGANNVPEIININSDIDIEERDNPLAYIDAGEPIYSVRFKAFLSRPNTINDAESYTPVLSKYSLQIYPTGGL